MPMTNVKENLLSLCVRNDFHQYPTTKNYMLDTSCAQLQTTKSSHICMQIRLFYKLLERARTVDINKFINTLDGWFKDNCF